MGSDAVLSSHGHPVSHGWILQCGEGQLREIQALCHQTVPGAGHRARQGLLFFPISDAYPELGRVHTERVHTERIHTERVQRLLICTSDEIALH